MCYDYFMSYKKKLQNHLMWKLENVAEDIIYRSLYKIGLGKYILKFNQIIEVDKDDMEYREYRQYIARRNVIAQILHREWVDLSLEVGNDSLHLIHHYIHKKKDEIEVMDIIKNNTKYSDLSATELNKILKLLFEAIGCKVQEIDSHDQQDQQICDLVIKVEHQKLLLYVWPEKSVLQATNIPNILLKQGKYGCSGTIIVSIPGFTDEASDLANAKNSTLVNKDKLDILAHQYLKEIWNNKSLL